MFAVRDILLTLMIFGSIPVIFVRPFFGIIVWSWIAYMVPHKMTWSFAASMPVAMIVGITTLLAWVISREPKKLPINSITVLILLLAFWISVTTLFAIVPEHAYPHWDTAIKVLLMTLVSIILINSRLRIDALVWTIVVSVGFFGVKGGIYMLTGGAGLVWGPPGGFFQDNNALALTLITVMPLMWYLQTRTWTKREWLDTCLHWGLRGAMVLSAIAVVGTYSRGAFVAGVASLGFLVLKSRHRGLLMVLAVVGLFAGIPFLPQSWIERIQSIENYEEDGSAQGRIQAWTFAVRVALDRPLVGGGFKVNAAEELYLSYVPEADQARAFHSVYFQLLGEHGFVGLAIFLSLTSVAFFMASGIIRKTKGKTELAWANDLARMLQVSIVGFCIAGLFLNLAFFDLYYHMVALILLTHLVLAKEVANQKPGSTEERRERVRRGPPSRLELLQKGGRTQGGPARAYNDTLRPRPLTGS